MMGRFKIHFLKPANPTAAGGEMVHYTVESESLDSARRLAVEKHGRKALHFKIEDVTGLPPEPDSPGWNDWSRWQ